MKPFLGIDLTNRNNEPPANGAEFLVAKPSTAMAQTLNTSAEKASQTVTKATLPLPLRICQLVAGGAAALIALGIFKGLLGSDSISIAQSYQNAPWLFWVCAGCLIVWAALRLIGHRKAKAVLESDEGVHDLSHLETTCAGVYAELAVPSDANDVDILAFYYKVKDGEVRACEKPMQLYSHRNPSFKAFSDGENLYLANLKGKCCFPLQSLQAIRRQNTKVRVPDWNKESAPTEGIYKQYKMHTDQFGCVHIKPYYILELEHGGETWGIYFPCYELPVFEALTGLKAE